MNATSNKFKTSFCNWPCLDGREHIEADLGSGVTVRAYVEHDPFAKPDPDNVQDVEAFNADTLHYCTMTLNVYINRACVAREVRSLHQIGIDDNSESNGSHLTECANNLLGEIDIAAIVGKFARVAAKAARAMKKGGAR